MEWDAFLLGNGNFASQDYRMKQSQKMLAYAKALQFWAEKPNHPRLTNHTSWQHVWKSWENYGATDIVHQWGSPHQGTMSHWVKVISSQPSELAEPETMWEQSCSRCRRACTQGSFLVTYGIGCSKLTITPMVNTSTVSRQMTGASTISSQGAKTSLGSPVTTRQMPPPSFAEIARSPRGDDCTHITINIPQELTTT